jgi:16S rRNA (cytosine1402-N4)-methyltransferase
MHIPVLLKETIELCNLNEGDVVVDATVGSGGHTVELMRKVGKAGLVVALDVDPKSLKQTKERIKQEAGDLAKQVVYVNENFAELEKVVKQHCPKKPQAIIADLGWRIEQVEDKQRGMSFQTEQELDMRLNPKQGNLTAKDIVNEWSEEELRDIFNTFSDERYAKKIATAIVEARRTEPISKTTQLADVVTKVKRRKGKIHPATKTFQALRMVVNNEVGNLQKMLDEAINVLDQGGRLAVISFHSLEDRIIKNIFRINTGGCVCPKEAPTCLCGVKRKIKKITKKPVRPSEEEIRANPRSRSAKLRVVEKL